jgi:UDP-GlcNAc:undecaprenyl-phosphate/decaprenyl-phosphate GlcNAc-1-phosphate transferase
LLPLRRLSFNSIFAILNYTMGFVILAFGIAFLITFLAIPVIIRVAEEKKLVDVPDERKVHKNPIPSLGGIGIFAGFAVASLIEWPNHIASLLPLQYIMASCCIIFFLGMKDDIMDISPLKKFIGQLIAAWVVIYKCKLQITGFHGVFGLHGELPQVPSLVLTYVTVVLIINSFNLIDGVDGLSGSLGFTSAVIFSLYFYQTSHFGYAVLGSALAGAVGAFLIFNHHPAKIFMGDTGSLLLGLLNAIMVIKFIQVASNTDTTGITTSASMIFKNAPVLGIAIMFVPLFDTLRVFAIRILHGRSPFSPDRNHIHHILLDKNLSHNRVTFYLFMANILFIAIAWLTEPLGPTASLLILISAAALLFSAVYFTGSRKLKSRKNNNGKKKNPKDKDGPRIINMVRDAVM